MSKHLPDTKSDILPGAHFASAARARSYTWGHLARRATWNLVWALLASWTPPPLHRWRRFLLNLFGARIARGARVYGSVKVWYPPHLEMGEGAVLGPHVVCYCMGRIVIADYATVSQYTHLVTGTHDYDSPTFQLYNRPIHVDRHAWLASSSFVGPGVTVNEGAVLGARGVAMKDLDAWTVYAGNPAVAVRQRVNFSAAEPGAAD